MLKYINIFFISFTMLFANVLEIKTGQSRTYKSGDDGFYQMGTERSYYRDTYGIVIDNATALEWQDNLVSTKMSWKDANIYCTNLVLNGTGWRLPNIKELISIVDRGRFNVSTDPIFQNTILFAYWSSTSFALNNELAIIVYFSDGHNHILPKVLSTYTRCVRGKL